MSYDLKKLNEVFFTHPDWSQIEDLLREYIEPFKSVLNIPEGLSNDQIATEVRGRQRMVEQLERFLEDSHLIKSRISNPKQNFK